MFVVGVVSGGDCAGGDADTVVVSFVGVGFPTGAGSGGRVMFSCGVLLPGGGPL